MSVTRRLARPMLASVFLASGYEAFRQPEPKVAASEPVTGRIASALPMSCDTRQLVRANAGVQLGAGTLLVLGRLPRLAAAALAASLVPTTLAGHRFWEQKEPVPRAQQRTQFLKNVGLMGGLILALFDWEGTPSPGWRARRAACGMKRAATVATGRSRRRLRARSKP